MSGKEKRPGWGGARAGAGRPKKTKTSSEQVRAAYRKAAKELAKEFGEPIEKAVLRLAYLENTQDSVRVAVLKAYNDVLVARQTEQNVNVNKTQAPAIFLPEKKPDPAKLVPITGGKAEGKKEMDGGSMK
jgi:hypothetical protein